MHSMGELDDEVILLNFWFLSSGLHLELGFGLAYNELGVPCTVMIHRCANDRNNLGDKLAT